MAKNDSISAAFNQGTPRRRKAGEKSGPAATLEDEKLLTVSVPLSLHRELKAVAAQSDLTMKEMVINGIKAEIQRLT